VGVFGRRRRRGDGFSEGVVQFTLSHIVEERRGSSTSVRNIPGGGQTLDSNASNACGIDGRRKLLGIFFGTVLSFFDNVLEKIEKKRAVIFITAHFVLDYGRKKNVYLTHFN
jgi:hypothetical protein